jgi:hypothetical protein
MTPERFQQIDELYHAASERTGEERAALLAQIDPDSATHEFIDHTEEYVKGRVRTNGLENFWSQFKRALKGTYVSVEPFHLQAYADEQAFRFNNRKVTDGERFSMAVDGIVGKRITFDQLTGKAGEAQA